MNRQELKYIIYAGIFMFAYFVFLLPKLITTFDGESVLFQFIFFNLGLSIFFVIFLKAKVTNSSFHFKTAIGLTALFIGLDCILPEYHVLVSGTLVKGAAMGVSASDYAIGLLGQSFGLQGIYVYLFTYLLTPIILFWIAAETLPNFVREL